MSAAQLLNFYACGMTGITRSDQPVDVALFRLNPHRTFMDGPQIFDARPAGRGG